MSPEETETLNLRSLTQKLGECTRQVEVIERCYGRGCADCYRTCNLAARLGGRDATLSAPASEAEPGFALSLHGASVSGALAGIRVGVARPGRYIVAGGHYLVGLPSAGFGGGAVRPPKPISMAVSF